MLGRASVLATMAVCALACGTAQAAPGDGGTPETAAMAPAQLETALVAEMNRVRAARGRAPLAMAPALRRPARGQSRFLLGTGQFTHDGPDGSPFWTRLVASGFPRDRYMAENLAQVSGCGADVARRTVAMWMTSPGHRANLLGPRYRWVGAGVATGGGCSSTVVTADFGS